MRPNSAIATLSAAGFAAALLLGLAAGFGTRAGLLELRFGIDVLLHWCVYAGAAGMALGLIAVLGALFSGGGQTRRGLIGLIGSALVLALPLNAYRAYLVSPPIHDITTDIADPPQFQALLALRKDASNKPDYDGNAEITWNGKTKTVAEWQRKAYTDIHTLQLLITPAKMYRRALRAVGMMGWTVVAQSPEEGRIEATDTSVFFGLTDDIVIRVRPSGIGAKLDIRSESRIGQSDLGRNADAIRTFIRTVIKKT